MITPDEFRELYIKHSKTSMAFAIGGTIIGLIAFPSILLFADEPFGIPTIYGTIFTGLLIVLGPLGILANKKHKDNIVSGNDPLLKGIELGNSDYVKWFYMLVLKHKKRQPPNDKIYAVCIYNDKKEIFHMDLDDEEQANAALELLSKKFPEAVGGYSEEIKQKMEEKYGFTL